MKKYLITLLMFVTISVSSQAYISITSTLSNNYGGFDSKINPSVEVGYQYDVFSLGLVGGKTSLIKMTNDTTTYTELRANLNIFQQGKFTNTMTIGGGYIFNARNYLLTELTYTIEISLTEHFHINILAGQYFYSGLETMTGETVVGASLVYFFKPNNKKDNKKYESK